MDAFEDNVGLFAQIGCQRSNGGTNYGQWTEMQTKWCASNVEKMRTVTTGGLAVPAIIQSELESALLEMEEKGGKLNETSVTRAIERCVFKASAVEKEADVSTLLANQKLFHSKDQKAQTHGASLPKANTRNFAEALIFFFQFHEQQDAKQKMLPLKIRFNEIDREYQKQLSLQSQASRVAANKGKAKAKKAKKERFTGKDIKLADKRNDRESQADGTPGAFEDITPEYLASLEASKKDGLTVWCNEWVKSGRVDGETPAGKIVEIRYTDPVDSREKKITNITQLMTFLTDTLAKFDAYEAPSLDLHMRFGGAGGRNSTCGSGLPPPEAVKK